MQIKIERDNLVRLLKKTQRPQTISGKSMEQVYGCILQVEGENINTTSLVKDGVTSVSRFIEPLESSKGDEGQIPVPNIGNVLGVLNMHNSPVTLTYEGEKLRIKSGSKQTTLTVSGDALAFPHSPDLLHEWFSKSEKIAGKFSIDLGGIPQYTKNDGEALSPVCSVVLSANVLYEALRCDGINGQKLNHYTFLFNSAGLHVSVGNELKGLTSSLVCDQPFPAPYQTIVNGGLENVLKHIEGEITLSLFNFTEANMGMPIVITTSAGELIYQAANLGEISYVR